MLVAPGVCRYSIVADFLGETVVNVCDMAIDTEEGVGDLAGRANGIAAVAGDLLDSWVANILPRLGINYSFRSVDWVDLNSADGEVGSINATPDNALPLSGGRNADPHPSSVAILVKKEISGGRGERAGRMFLAGVIDDDASGNVLLPSVATALNAAFAQFLTDMSVEGTINDQEFKPVVVHTKAGQFTRYTDISSYNVRAPLTTQVRRLPQR
uniref:Uncharacterized protein n=1 Tax=uncultured prokaryote TaxID=198431 RepID=A0A0H5QLH6_9ZZZZ|nr:hypothetical protein [uncultured prokaryote]